MMSVEPKPTWWTYPFKPVRVDPGMFDRLDCSNYTMELKYDGWRAIVIAGRNGTSLWTRERKPIQISKALEEELRSLGLPEGTVLDGEIWNPNKRGGWKDSEAGECKLTMWDAIRVGSTDMRSEPIEGRRQALTILLGGGRDNIKAVRVLEASRKIHDEALKEALEVRGASRSGFVHGVVLKRNGSPRRDSNIRSVEHPDWLKMVFTELDASVMR